MKNTYPGVRLVKSPFPPLVKIPTRWGPPLGALTQVPCRWSLGRNHQSPEMAGSFAVPSHGWWFTICYQSFATINNGSMGGLWHCFTHLFFLLNIWWLIKIPLSGNGHSSRKKSRIFRELHVYLSWDPCWATTLLMKIHSSPAKSRQIFTDNFFIAL